MQHNLHTFLSPACFCRQSKHLPHMFSTESPQQHLLQAPSGQQEAYRCSGLQVYRDLVLNMRLPPPAAALQVLQGAVSPKAAAMAAASAEAAGANPRDFVVDTTLEASPAALQMVKAHLQGELSDPMTSPGMASLSLGRNSLSPGS